MQAKFEGNVKFAVEIKNTGTGKGKVRTRMGKESPILSCDDAAAPTVYGLNSFRLDDLKAGDPLRREDLPLQGNARKSFAKEIGFRQVLA